VHRLTPTQARRIAVRAQLLDAPRPTDLLDVVRQLTLVQVDLTAAVAPHPEVLLWSRLGSRGFARSDLEEAVVERSLVELHGLLRPAEDVALFRADMARWRGPDPPYEWQRGAHAWVELNDRAREDILEELRREGPQPARGIPDSCEVPWRSSGWTAGKNVMKMLEIMECRGEVAVSSRERRERWWDLAERVFPDDPDDAPDAARAREERDRRRLRALGVARAVATKTPNEPDDVGPTGEEVEIAGVPGTWRVDPEQLALVDEPFRGRTALLSPLDRLVMDRRRLAEVFGFEYFLEMYKPAAKRRWGYWAMPVLHGDRLVGKLDATADRAGGVLRVAAIHEDRPFTAALHRAVQTELRDLARYLDLEVVDER
jgi:uncharacterized protein YcaQ